MTTPITHRPLMKPGRKPNNPPANAADRIRAFAADGFSMVGVAAGLGVTREQLAGWLERDPALQEAFDQGREQERLSLHQMLYRKAMEKGDTTAAMMLLNSRHGYRSDQSDQGNRVNINIALPGAMTLEQFTALTSKGTIDG